MGISKGEHEELTLDGNTVTDTDELLLGLETFGDTDDHVVNKGAVQAVHRTMTGLVGRTGEFDLIILNGDFDIRIDFLGKLTKRAFHLHHVAGEYLNTHLRGDDYRQFTNS
jgi:hypothetical protein